MLSTSTLTNVGSAGMSSCEPSVNRINPLFPLFCIVCNDIYADPNVLYEHMRNSHSELYVPTHAIAEVYDLDEDECDRDISDEEYSELWRLLEPICEIQQIDDDTPSVESHKNAHSNGNSQVKHQIQSKQQPDTTQDSKSDQKVVLRKCQFEGFPRWI